MWGLVGHFRCLSSNCEMRSHWRKGNREPLQDAKQEIPYWKVFLRRLVSQRYMEWLWLREPSSEYIVLIPVNGDSFIQLLGAKDVPNSIQRIYSRVIKRELPEENDYKWHWRERNPGHNDILFMDKWQNFEIQSRFMDHLLMVHNIYFPLKGLLAWHA